MRTAIATRRGGGGAPPRTLTSDAEDPWFLAGANDLGGGQLVQLLAASGRTPRLANNPPSLISSPGTPGIAPNFDDPIVVTEDTLVPFGTTFYTTSLFVMVGFTNGFFWEYEFVNNGALWNIGANAQIAAGMNTGPVTNNGLMVADSPTGFAQAFLSTSGFTGFHNTGQVFALAEQSWATAFEDWGGTNGVVYNSGLIAARSLENIADHEKAPWAIGVLRRNGGHFHNSPTGTVLAEGEIAEAVTIAGANPHPPGFQEVPSFVNEGLIEARSTDPARLASAVQIGSLGMHVLTVLNWGTIRGDVALRSGASTGSGEPQREKTFINFATGLLDGAVSLSELGERLINRGRIEGDVAMGGGHDMLVNEGVIVGAVNLGTGSDSWLSTAAGQLQGAVAGGDGGDQLFGSAAADTMAGEAGDDLLHGGGGGDQLNGGGGRDVFAYSAASDSTEAAFDTIADFFTGSDRIDLSALAVQSFSIQPGAGFTLLSVVTAGGTLAIHVLGGIDGSDIVVSNLAAIGGTAGADTLHATAGGSTLTGAAGDDSLFGGAGNDRLDGGEGIDLLRGGRGDDVYVVDQSNDEIWEMDGEGRDSVEFHMTEYRLPSFVEDITAFGATSFTFVHGNDLGNRMTGNAVINTFQGGRGDDVLIGGGGDDRLQGDLGADEMTGGSGADQFIFMFLADCQAPPPRSDGRKYGTDLITDFTPGEDKIDLTTVDAVDDLPFGQAFTFIGGAAFSGQAGELRIQAAGDRFHILGDTNGDGLADLHIVAIAPSLQASDFLL